MIHKNIYLAPKKLDRYKEMKKAKDLQKRNGKMVNEKAVQKLY